jgi:hypothetical protein
MDLFAVRRIKGKKPVGLFWARGFNSLRPDGLRAIVSEHCAPELCEAAFVDEAIAFVGPTNAAGRVDFKSLTDWQPLVHDGESRPYLIRLMQRGKPYYYFRVGDNRTPLPGKPGEKEFEAAYAAALDAETAQRSAAAGLTDHRVLTGQRIMFRKKPRKTP